MPQTTTTTTPSTMNAAQTIMGGIAITLDYPIKTGTGETITQLTMRRASRADLKAAARHSTNEVEQEDYLFMRLCSLPIEDLDKLDVVDNEKLLDSFRNMRKPTAVEKNARGDAIKNR